MGFLCDENGQLFEIYNQFEIHGPTLSNSGFDGNAESTFSGK